jgi:CheY-like chemotaxis protein
MIVLVASQEDERRDIADLISALGYPIDAMGCGDDVLTRLRFRGASLVILDCAVPDSFAILSRIRRESRTRATPVVMFSVESQDLRREALLRGADGCVPKGSLDWAELMEEIRRLAGAPPGR